MTEEEFLQLEKTLTGLMEAARAAAASEQQKRRDALSGVEIERYSRRSEFALGRADGLHAARQALWAQYDQQEHRPR